MIRLAASQLLPLLQREEISAAELTQAYLAAIRRHDGNIGAFLHVDEKWAMAQAHAIDDKRRQGDKLGPLGGLPVAIKDAVCIAGQPTTCASKILRDFVPPYDAHVITRLRQADAVLLGKTNMDEFAMGSSTENSGFKITRNPWDPQRTPGGSSGGSAAAVAACLAPLALGTDTGGSIRQPAALCGITGVKPSYGRVSRFGLIAYGSSLDQVGPFAHDVAGAALLLQVLAGHDPRDSTCVDLAVPSFLATLDQPVTPLTIGVPREFFGEGQDAEVEQAVREAIRVYEKLGARIEEISLPHSPYAVATYYLVATAEASSNLARYDGVHFGHRSAEFKDLLDMVCQSRGQGFGPEVKRRIMLGTHVLSTGYVDAYYLKALRVRRLIKNDFDQAFTRCDVILGPTSPTAAFKIGEKIDDPLAMYLSDICTISANLSGIAGMSIPCGFTKQRLPIGLQILAPAFAEEKMLRTAWMYERETQWHLQRPELI